ncbi:hypothetical protein PspLS_06537 [Pyricularia sp. CBS 133598]|nr:hypothetical protein PspLS_06537 [Pyricularia sp. CBS 133598]
MVSAIAMILSGRKSPPFLPTRFSTRVGPAQGSVLGPNGVKFKFACCLTNRSCWVCCCWIPCPDCSAGRVIILSFSLRRGWRGIPMELVNVVVVVGGS